VFQIRVHISFPIWEVHRKLLQREAAEAAPARSLEPTVELRGDVPEVRGAGTFALYLDLLSPIAFLVNQVCLTPTQVSITTAMFCYLCDRTYSL
jgi:hypothetical protein